MFTYADYVHFCSAHPNSITLRPVGLYNAFFEAYNEDAVYLAQFFNLALHKRQIDGSPIPTVAIPYHALDNYIATCDKTIIVMT